jgi:uncharacterized membrane protein YraQ (UPF0718 family)/copper chaperone CopZ
LSYIKEFFVEFIELFNEMSPYLLLGFLLAGVLHVYFPKDRVNKYLGKKNLKSVFNAALLGIPLPLCSCGVIPTGVSFHKNGASKGSAVSFLISTPQTGVDSILVTYSLMGLPFAIIRPIVAFITGIVGGYATNVVDTEKEQPVPTITTENLSRGNKFKRMLRYAFVDFLADIAKWLTIGLVIAAIITVLIPDGFFNQQMSNEYINMLIVLAASIPMYVCATGSVPIAAALMLKGISPGAAFVFLMAGPATNAGTITVIGQSLGRKSLIAYMASIMVGAILSGIFINAFLPENWFLFSDMHAGHGDHSSHLLPLWLKYSSSIVLGALIINVFIQQVRNKTRKTTMATTAEGTVYNIEGMTCNHCKASVEKNLAKLEGVESVEVNLERQEALVKGKGIADQAIEDTIEDLGYQFKGKK